MVLALSRGETENEPKLTHLIIVKCYNKGLLKGDMAAPEQSSEIKRTMKTYVVICVHNRIIHDNQKVAINVLQPIDRI